MTRARATASRARSAATPATTCRWKLFDDLLKDEEGHIDFLETQIALLDFDRRAEIHAAAGRPGGRGGKEVAASPHIGRTSARLRQSAGVAKAWASCLLRRTGSEDSMAFRVNYNQQRSDRQRLKDQKKQEKLQRREQDAAEAPGGARRDAPGEPPEASLHATELQTFDRRILMARKKDARPGRFVFSTSSTKTARSAPTARFRIRRSAVSTATCRPRPSSSSRIALSARSPAGRAARSRRSSVPAAVRCRRGRAAYAAARARS